MKYFIIGLIKIYQLVPGPWHKMCRYTPSCSNYTIDAIKTFGAFKGSILGFKRILRCNPWGGMGYDPVPERIKK